MQGEQGQALLHSVLPGPLWEFEDAVQRAEQRWARSCPSWTDISATLTWPGHQCTQAPATTAFQYGFYHGGVQICRKTFQKLHGIYRYRINHSIVHSHTHTQTMYAHTYTHAHICTHIHTHTHTHMHTCTNTHAYTYTHTCTYMYEYICIHIHTQHYFTVSFCSWDLKINLSSPSCIPTNDHMYSNYRERAFYGPQG